MLVARNYQPSSLVRLLPATPAIVSTNFADPFPSCLSRFGAESVITRAPQTDPLYLFACQVEWRKRAEPSAAWELMTAAKSTSSDTRAQALALIENALQATTEPSVEEDSTLRERRISRRQVKVKNPYGLEMIESCMSCKARGDGFFCRFSPKVLRGLDEVSHHTVMPAGAVLFVEGQTPRGVFLLCSGVVKLSATSKEGKVLVLKQSSAGEVLGLSAALSGTNYEVTAEAATACQLNFVARQDLMKLLQGESEVGANAAFALSREFQAAYREIQGLILARSSSGKLARLLLSSSVPMGVANSTEFLFTSDMTHEEMAQRIGTSRETVTRWLAELKRKRLIRTRGDTLIIRDRAGLEAMTV